MLRDKKQYPLILILFLLVLLSFWVKVPYRIHSNGLFLPMQQWSLGRTTNGALIANLQNNRTGTTKNYSVTEFQRGDVANFVVNANIRQNEYVNINDTIGRLASNEEERRLIQLLSELEVEKANLIFYTTGQKPEDVEKAAKQLELAKQAYAIQENLFARQEELYIDSLISEQEFEVAENDYLLAKKEVEVALANYKSVTTGDKPEQEALIRSKIDLIEKQLQKFRERLDAFTLVTPISGVVTQDKRGMKGYYEILEVLDTSYMIAMIPIPVEEKAYFSLDAPVYLDKYDGYERTTGHIINSAPQVEVVDGKQCFFAYALFNQNGRILPNSTHRIAVDVEEMTVAAYLWRNLQIVFYHH